MKIRLEKLGDSTSQMRCGHIAVRIKNSNQNGYTRHRLSWRVGKKGFRRDYSDETVALAEAERIVRSLLKSDGAATGLSGEDIFYFTECQRRLGKTPMHVAAEFYLKFHEYTDRNPKTFSEVFDLFYQKCVERKLSNRYYQTLRYHRNVWEPPFGKRHIDTISADEYVRFMKGTKFHDRTKHNLIGTLSALMRFARKQRFVAEDKTEIEANFGKLRATTPEYYTPDELCRLFIAAPASYLPYLAIMAFGGSRSAEASHKKLTYQNVLLEEKMIRLGPEITKTRTGRTLDIPANLEAWLTEFGKEGAIFPHSKVQPLCGDKLKAAGVKPKSNALRHSFCSYHLALYRNASHTAEIAGNSPRMLNEFYKALVSRSAAEEWFSITPDKVRTFAKENALDGLIAWGATKNPAGQQTSSNAQPT
jgi:hypothetical protein